MNTITASAVPTGCANGVMKSRIASNGEPGVSLTASGACSGAASSCRSLIAPAALPRSPCAGCCTAWIFSMMFSRYSGSLAASDTACLAAIPAMAAITEKASSTTIRVAGMRHSQRSRRRTAGASRKLNRIASASGISTSLARNSTAVTTTSAKTGEPRLSVRRAPSGAASAPSLRRDGRWRSGCPPAGPACWCRQAGSTPRCRWCRAG